MPETHDPSPGASEPFEATGSWRPSGSGARRSETPNGGSSVRRPPAPADLPAPGERLGPFLLQEAIGAGGMGAVYRALDLRLDRDIALKLLPPVQAQDPETVQRFYQEARSAARLDHENIARVFSIGHDGPYHFIAFEYIEGQTIRQKVAAGGPLAAAEAVNYTLQIATALVHAADRGVVHRDIKPSNIIVTPQGRAKLVDMGLARRHERDSKGDDLTHSGVTLGSFDYISPEQARDPRDVDVRSDLYSLGCTLFHMLAARPPFPEGTPVQKMMSHQTDAPPDVRALNPDVPPELAAILSRLMIKNRDRRYQTPDQLVRDLLSLAAALGLRSTSPEGLVWLATPAPEPWQRHLVWGLPSVALAGIVAMLVWWGQPIETPPGFDPAQPSLAATTPRKGLAAATPPRTGAPPAKPQAQASPSAPPIGIRPNRPGPENIAVLDTRGPTSKSDTNTSTNTDAADTFPATTAITLHAGDDLARTLARAPAGAVISLADAGPFELPWSPLGDGGPSTPARLRAASRDLTLRAAPGVRPIIRPARATDPALAADRALLPLSGGRVILEDLEFRIPAADPGRVAIAARDVDLTLRRCVLRTVGTPARPPIDGLLRLIGTGPDRPSPTAIDSCLFAGAGPAVTIEGPADVLGRDLAFGLPTTAFAIVGAGVDADADAGEPPWVRLRLSHLSLLMGDGPAFRIGRAAVSLRLDDAVLAPPPGRSGTLIAATNPNLLDWLGRGNLYGRIDTFLDTPDDAAGPAPIRSFEAWEEDATRVRELDSVATAGPTWASAITPASLLAGLPSTAAFAVDPAERPAPESGIRSGPFGPVADLTPGGPSRTNGVKPSTPVATLDPEVSLRPDLPDENGLPAPMIVAGTDPEMTSSSPRPDTATPPFTPPPSTPRPPTTTNDNGTDTVRSSTSFRRASDLQAALRRATAPSEPLRIAADADLVLATADLSGSGRWVIQGDPVAETGRRPRLRFRPQITDEPDPIAWMALFRLPAGGLELQDLDVVLDPAEVPSGCRLAGFLLGPGAELTLTRCTVTLIGPATRSAMTVVEAAPATPRDGPPGAEAMTSLVRIQDSLLRAGTDLIDVGGGGRLEVQAANSVLAASGSLIRGHGAPAATPDPRPIKLDLRRVAARLAGGLVQLDSEPGEPTLPQMDVVVRDSLLATAGRNAPLFRIDGQNDLDELRDRIRWEGHGVAYHQIDVYRRDQSSRPGTVPLPFRRSDWEVAIGPREDDPFHGEVQFAAPWPETRSPWTITPADFRLDPRSPAQSSLPDLDLIPEPPPLASP